MFFSFAASSSRWASFLAIEFRGVDPPCRAHALGGGESHLSLARADFGHYAALLPVQQRGQTVGFLLVGVLGAAGGNNEGGKNQRNNERAATHVNQNLHFGIPNHISIPPTSSFASAILRIVACAR